MAAADDLPGVPGEPSGSARASPAEMPHEAGSFDLERITFFSDAVVAIAMTLLVIDIRLPEWLTQTATDADLQAALGELARPIFACALSFFVIAMWWFGHHRIFRTLRDVDSRIVVLDLVFLGAIVFLPFPTTMIGRFANLTTAIVIYAATNVVAGGSLVLMRLRAEHARLYLPGIPPSELHRRLLFGAIGPAVFAASIPLAVVAPGWAALSWNLIWIFAVAFRVAYRVRDRRAARRSAETVGAGTP
jgi:TMEM175 potassium channel family protein